MVTPHNNWGSAYWGSTNWTSTPAVYSVSIQGSTGASIPSPLWTDINQQIPVPIQIPGYFAGLNSKFGFNKTPHSWDLEIVQSDFGGSIDNLPTLGQYVLFYV